MANLNSVGLTNPMNIQPKLGGVAKIRFYFGYEMTFQEITQTCRLIQCKPTNYIIIKPIKNIKNSFFFE